ncbi:MAG: hypothetical protein ACTH1D_13470 [Mycobacteriaceae bacterium]
MTSPNFVETVWGKVTLVSMRSADAELSPSPLPLPSPSPLSEQAASPMDRGRRGDQRGGGAGEA